MNGVNLIPEARRIAARRRVLARAWIIGGGAYSFVLVAALAWFRLTHGVDTARVDGAIAEASHKVTVVEAAIAQCRRELAEKEATVAANDAVGKQPDWSLLLALLSRGLKGESVLQSCTLTASVDGKPVRLASADGAAAPARGGEFLLTLSGMGRTQESVSRYILELERAGLFERVNLIETARSELLGGEAVLFKLECLLRDAPGGGS